ncbi:dicarboxylate/amino acid:cation symporter [Prevotella sp.]|uniref:dicarboxylate/amino acid:cation symporter n=1 Tax=Prevotella sp. TaxID=59823 RepID=UPI002A7F7237|nr:dicarboxylate/amino acid:cation symporter [Prevotella sp.]MDY4644415.1 dicarboxylate/amino acid:cation symporter [Prevotella sp.]
MDNKKEMAQHSCAESQNFWLWLGALVVGTVLGMLGVGWIDSVTNFVATIYTRLFQFVAIPTIALAVTTTLARFGTQKDTGRIFRHTLTYTLLTTAAAAAVGMLLYRFIAPDNLPLDAIQGDTGIDSVKQELGDASYMDYIIGIVPDNVLRPLVEGNVLSLLLIAVAVGIALARMPETDSKRTLMNGLNGLQNLVSTLIHWLIDILPIGIIAFAAQLSAEITAGTVVTSIGKYVAVILGGNLLQFCVVLPLFLMARGLNPIRVARAMTPAVLMALFTKSSAATLPVTIQSAEERLGVASRVARFVLPICTTINMNGCAAFIFVTSLFVMQNGGVEITWGTMIMWLFISVVAAIGNAGVPMGCYFLTLSLMSGVGAPIAIMGIILPVFTVLDMIETAENVWSDSCVAAMTDRDIRNASPRQA